MTAKKTGRDIPAVMTDISVYGDIGGAHIVCDYPWCAWEGEIPVGGSLPELVKPETWAHTHAEVTR